MSHASSPGTRGCVAATRGEVATTVACAPVSSTSSPRLIASSPITSGARRLPPYERSRAARRGRGVAIARDDAERAPGRVQLDDVA